MTNCEWLNIVLPLVGVLIGSVVSIITMKIQLNAQNKVENRKIAMDFLFHKIQKLENHNQIYDQILKHKIELVRAESRHDNDKVFEIATDIFESNYSKYKGIQSIMAYLPRKYDEISDLFESSNKKILEIPKEDNFSKAMAVIGCIDEVHTIVSVELFTLIQRFEKIVEKYT